MVDTVKTENTKNEMKIFANEEFGTVRTVVVDNEPMFCLSDVCKSLEIKNATDVAKRLDTDELTRFNLGGRSGETNFITESGLYAVILRSDKPNAKKFRKWVTSEVLPSIRKTRAYSMEPGITATQMERMLHLMEGQQRLMEQLASRMSSEDEQKAEQPKLPDKELRYGNNQSWICVKEQIFGKQSRTLAKELDCSQNEAVGLLIRFWLWTAKNIDEDGQIKAADREDIEDALGSGRSGNYSRGEAVDALIYSDLIDVDDGFMASDWDFWQDVLIKNIKTRRNDRERKRAERRRKKTTY